MNILICTFYTSNYSNVFYQNLGKWNTSFKNCSFYAATEVCENWPQDFNISRLKNTCIKAARNIKPDWMILLPGADCSMKIGRAHV